MRYKIWKRFCNTSSEWYIEREFLEKFLQFFSLLPINHITLKEIVREIFLVELQFCFCYYPETLATFKVHTFIILWHYLNKNITKLLDSEWSWKNFEIYIYICITLYLISSHWKIKYNFNFRQLLNMSNM